MWWTREWSVSKLNCKNLQDNNDSDDRNEHATITDSLKNIHFIFDFSGIQEIEDLHPYKDIKDKSEMSRWSVVLSK